MILKEFSCFTMKEMPMESQNFTVSVYASAFLVQLGFATMGICFKCFFLRGLLIYIYFFLPLLGIASWKLYQYAVTNNGVGL